VQLSRSDGTKETRYFHRDHLDSITAVSNGAGALLERFSYDVYGKRRLPSGADGAVNPSSTRRGYTGHEHLDEVGLIHMNGRVYDPQLGRFLSADPIVSDPGSTQGFNRYAYVYNNPLRAVDPSGFEPVHQLAPTTVWGTDITDLGYNYYGPTPPSSQPGGNYGTWTSVYFYGGSFAGNNQLSSSVSSGGSANGGGSGFDFGITSSGAGSNGVSSTQSMFVSSGTRITSALQRWTSTHRACGLLPSE
jgi:RHS repeat-associated protein